MAVAFGVVQVLFGAVLACLGTLVLALKKPLFGAVDRNGNPSVRIGITELILGICNLVLGVLAFCLSETFAPLGFFVGVVLIIVVLSIAKKA